MMIDEIGRGPYPNTSHSNHLELVEKFTRVVGLFSALQVINSTPVSGLHDFQLLGETATKVMVSHQSKWWVTLANHLVCEKNDSLLVPDFGTDDWGETNGIARVGELIQNVIAKFGNPGVHEDISSSRDTTSWETSLQEIAASETLEVIDSLPDPDFEYRELLGDGTYLLVSTYSFPGFLAELICHHVKYGGKAFPQLLVNYWPHQATNSDVPIDSRQGTILQVGTESILEATNKYLEARNLVSLFPLSDASKSTFWRLIRPDNGARILIKMRSGFGSKALLEEGLNQLYEVGVIPEDSFELPETEEEDSDSFEIWSSGLSRGLYQHMHNQKGLLTVPKELMPDFSGEAVTKIGLPDPVWGF